MENEVVANLGLDANDESIEWMYLAGVRLEAELRVRAAALTYSFNTLRKQRYEQEVTQKAKTMPPAEAAAFVKKNYYRLYLDVHNEGEYMRFGWVTRWWIAKGKSVSRRVVVSKEGTSTKALIRYANSYERDLVLSAENERARISRLQKQLKEMKRVFPQILANSVSTCMWIDLDNVGAWKLNAKCFAGWGEKGKERLDDFLQQNKEFATKYFAGYNDNEPRTETGE